MQDCGSSENEPKERRDRIAIFYRIVKARNFGVPFFRYHCAVRRRAIGTANSVRVLSMSFACCCTVYLTSVVHRSSLAALLKLTLWINATLTLLGTTNIERCRGGISWEFCMWVLLAVFSRSLKAKHAVLTVTYCDMSSVAFKDSHVLSRRLSFSRSVIMRKALSVSLIMACREYRRHQRAFTWHSFAHPKSWCAVCVQCYLHFFKAGLMITDYFMSIPAGVVYMKATEWVVL